MTDEWAEVQNALKKLPEVMQKKVADSAARAGARVIANEAKRLVPVDTGLLKKSIGVAKAKKSDSPEGIVRFYIVPKSNLRFTTKSNVGGSAVKVRTKVSLFHAHFVEFGTVNMSARPFLRPAMENTQGEVVKAAQEYALKRVEKEVRKLAK